MVYISLGLAKTEVTVTDDGQPIEMINELEMIGPSLEFETFSSASLSSWCTANCARRRIVGKRLWQGLLGPD